jgi:hypothetical protein
MIFEIFSPKNLAKQLAPLPKLLLVIAKKGSKFGTPKPFCLNNHFVITKQKSTKSTSPHFANKLGIDVTCIIFWHVLYL